MARRFGMRQGMGRKRSKCPAVTWTLLAAVTASCIAVGSCALWLPDRTLTLLSSAGERTAAPASVREYAGTQQVTVVPTISSDRDLSGNASGMVTADWSGNGLTSGKGAYQVNDRTVVALNTATPLYRDLKTGDTGGDSPTRSLCPYPRRMARSTNVGSDSGRKADRRGICCIPRWLRRVRHPMPA